MRKCGTTSLICNATVQIHASQRCADGDPGEDEDKDKDENADDDDDGDVDDNISCCECAPASGHHQVPRS